MSAGTSAALLREIQTLFDVGTAAGLSDRQLLERFAGRRDAAAEAAFEVLVLRHGPMVLRVCRNWLHDPNDAQDAFQATFLVLVRRMGAVRNQESVGGWLYGVANRVAARARVEAARRRTVEGRAALRVVEGFESDDPAGIDSEEFGPIVQEELRRLPGKYRDAVVLCYWEGLTQEQAAVHLGIPLGTVRSRVSRARDLLRRRLTRRGLAPTAVMAMAGTEGASSSALRLATVSAELTRSTVRSAIYLSAGQATNQVASGVVVSLVQRVLWSMTMIKISIVTASVGIIGLAGIGAGLAAQQATISRSRGPDSQVEARPAAKAGDSARPQPQRPRNANDPEKTQASGIVTISSKVYYQTVIVAICPEGKLVKKGEVICELESSAWRNQLVNQRITTKSAEANFQNAKLNREVAEIAVTEYTDGILISELTDIEGDIKVSQAEMALAEDELNAAKEAGGGNRLAVKRAELDRFRAKIALEKAQARRKVLVNYTKGKTLKALHGEIEKSRSDELSRGAVWELEKLKEAKLEKRIADCTIVAPIDGVLQYAKKDPTMGGAIGPQFYPGSIVNGQQILFRIVPGNKAAAE